MIKPVEDDADIVLVKDLHEPRTKEELAEHLCVGEKTIRNKLRAIDEGTGGIRLGGQRVHVKISKTQEDSQTKCQYQTKNRMHPLILQLNTTQLGCLLTALAQDDIDYAINRITASYIWDQLSEYAKTRIKKIFVSRRDFRQDVERANQNGNVLHDRLSMHYSACQAEMERLLALYDGEKHTVFVYGTLMRDRSASHLMKNATFCDNAVLHGYAMYDLGDFPGIVPDTYKTVLGEVWFVDDETLAELDRYEDEGTLVS